MPASIIPKCADGSAMAALGEERLNVVDFRPATPAVWKPCRTELFLTSKQDSGSMATAAGRISEERRDDRRVAAVPSESRARSFSSSKYSCDPIPDGSSFGWLPAVWGRGLVVPETLPRKQQERDHHPRKHVFRHSSDSRAAADCFQSRCVRSSNSMEVLLPEQSEATRYCPSNPDR